MPLLADYLLPDHEWVAESEAEISSAISGRTGFENKQVAVLLYWEKVFPRVESIFRRNGTASLHISRIPENRWSIGKLSVLDGNV